MDRFIACHTPYTPSTPPLHPLHAPYIPLQVDRFIVRDSDSRLNARERLAVEEWIQSGTLVHSLRDHPNHDRPLNGGMWGGRKGAVPDMASLVRELSSTQPNSDPDH